MKRRHREIGLWGLAPLAVAIVSGVGATLSCSNDAASGVEADGGATGATVGAGSEDAGSVADASPVGVEDASVALSATQIDFSTVTCGAPAKTATLTVRNVGAAPMVVSATTSGAAFAASPSVLTLNLGASANLTVTATVPTTATAGLPIVGSLDLSIGTWAQTDVAVPLSVTPSGASLAFAQGQPTTFAFPLTEVGYPGTLAITLVNAGNAPATFDIGTPSDPRFRLAGDAGTTLAAGETWTTTADFAATDTTTARATSTVVATGATCGASLQTLTYSARGTTGEITGWPTTVDFGAAECGGAAPAEQSFGLTNNASVDAHITQVTMTGTPGFTTNAKVGRAIFANGGLLDITVDAPPVPALSASGPVTATLTIQTDAESTAHVITLTEEPDGAILAFDTSGTAAFGSFGLVPLLDSEVQTFHVINTGTGPANVTLTASPSPAFTVSSPTFAIDDDGSQAEMVTFAPRSGGSSTGSISISATGALCAPLPAPIPLSGTSGPAPNVTPTSLSFAAVCGGAAPGAQAFMVENGGNGDMTWSMSAVTGAGAAQYALSASPPPGLLIPGASAIVTVSAAALPSPVANADPSAFAGQVVITTDVPFDPPHVVSLGETPLGDQLSFSTVAPLRFGQVPIGSALTQTFTVTNNANPGSSSASFSFVVEGAGASGYAVAPSLAANVSPNGGISSGENIAFNPSESIAYPATVGITTSDKLCSPLPAPVAVSGTGTLAQVALSASTLAFGTDPADSSGFVDCGKAGLPQMLTVSNVGNQSFHLTGMTFGLGTSSPYTLSGAGSLPALVPIGGSVTLTVTPAAIPSNVADPGDATPFSDTLTVTTDAPLDAPHAVRLVMQAHGAVVADTPLATTWSFGTVSPGSIATLTSTITNTGNGSLSIALDGLLQPTIFGLRNNPTTAAASGVSSIVAQFTPSSSNGSWSDVGTLSVSAPDGLCEPLPSQWTNPTITLSGRSQ